MPAWIAARLGLQRQRVGRETLAVLAERCEGNLLAARQEIEKLGLLLPEGELDAEAVERAVSDVARYDVFQLSEAWLTGDAARALRIIAALEAEGEGIQLLLWQLGEDIHALAFVLDAAASGTPVAIAVRNARVWGKRQAAMERAARRLKVDVIAPLLAALARLDALSKGIGRGSVWDELRTTVLAMAGERALPLPVMR
jgi:DNA polymerase-3 subunit delta